MNQQEFLRRLGVTMDAIQAVRRAPNAQAAAERLDALKDEARRRYRKLVFELHPDRGGDPESFKLLTQVYEEVQKLRVQPQQTRPVFRRVIVNIPAPTATTTSATTTFPGFTWVVNMRP